MCIEVHFSFRLRVQRYDSGEYFKPHFDAGFRRENGEKSFLSVQIFLNDVRKHLMLMFINHCSYVCAKINRKVLLYTYYDYREQCSNLFICLQDFLGGDTTFLDLEESERIEVEPRTGKLFFSKYKY